MESLTIMLAELFYLLAFLLIRFNSGFPQGASGFS
jgi:hypothetical protein